MRLVYLLFFFVPFFSISQSNFQVVVNNLQEGDSALILIQKSSEVFIKQWIKSEESSRFFQLDEGAWAVKIDARGYTFPSQQIVNIPEDSKIIFSLTPLSNVDFTYTWEDDGSAAGHATHRYINEPTEVVIINDTISVPNDFSAIKLLYEFGIVLSNEKEEWSVEDSYRLYKTFSSLPINPYREGQKMDFTKGDLIRGVFVLSSNFIPDDISIEVKNGIKYVTLGQAAFTYSSPLIVTIDGIKGKFYSKRLYQSIVKFITNFGLDRNAINWLARESFGVEFMEPDQRTQDLMGEDKSNFQSFFSSEIIEILSMFEELPHGFQKQDGLKYIVRRINGQDNPVYPQAAAIAWTGKNTIEFMSKAFSNSDIGDIRRLILHEKAHFLWEYTFNDEIREEWAELGGWFIDPTSPSGWSTYNTTEAVSGYAHLLNPNEDMAESIAFYLTNPEALMSVSMRKFEFIRDRIMHGTRYISQIREDLTFTVYNLFPDYVYPGKVVKIEIDVKGGAEENKIVTVRATLNSSNPQVDGASFGYMRFSSLVGSIHDMGLIPENGSNLDSVLVGTTTFNKHQKNGYWRLDFFRIRDLVGNYRNENTSTIGFKLFIENPLEDIESPLYNGDYKMELVEDNFQIQGFQAYPDQKQKKSKALKISFSYYDDSPTSRGYVRLNVPNNTTSEVYNRDLQGPAIIRQDSSWANDYKSNKHFELFLPIFEYFQNGWYSTTYSFATDIAGNTGTTYHVIDTAGFLISELNKNKIFKEVRDSIFVTTNFPDYLNPEIDINNIHISASPTNPNAPDGETRVEIDILARDHSDFPGFESGVYRVNFVLRDPLGGRHGYQTGNNTMNNPDLDHHNSFPQNDNLWRPYHFNLLLPKGSPPGKWGLESAEVLDRAGNRKQYSFVEYVRFDVIESDLKLEIPVSVKILDKFVNEKNVEGISAKIICSPCSGLNYNYTIYSLMGGNVIKGNGIFDTDTVFIQNINTQGLIDGILKITTQVSDGESRLVSSATSEFSKDTERPKSFYIQSNLENEGSSSFDDFLINVIVEKIDIGGTFKLSLKNIEKVDLENDFFDHGTTIAEGKLSDTLIQIQNIDFERISNGFFVAILTVIDSFENEGQNFFKTFFLGNEKVSEVNYSLDCNPFLTIPVWINAPKDTSISCQSGLNYVPIELNYSLNLKEFCNESGTVLATKSENFGKCGETWEFNWSFTDDFGRTITHTQKVNVNNSVCSFPDNDIEISEPLLSSGDFFAKKSIISSNNINNNATIHFTAGETIILKPGFSVANGCNFTGLIESCDESNSNLNIQNEPILYSFKLYPNPVFDDLNIDFYLNEPKFLSFYLLDISGRIISQFENKYFNSGFNKEVFNLSDVNSGIFFLKINGEKFSEIQKIIVTK